VVLSHWLPVLGALLLLLLLLLLQFAAAAASPLFRSFCLILI